MHQASVKSAVPGVFRAKTIISHFLINFLLFKVKFSSKFSSIFHSKFIKNRRKPSAFLFSLDGSMVL